MELSSMKKWFVVQVLAGYEDRIRADLLKSIEEQGLHDKFGEILIPAAKAKPTYGAEQIDDQQLFPGYMLLEMEPEQATIRLVAKTPRISRFLGGKEPSPISDKEIERILAQIRGEVVVSVEKHTFEPGSEVEINEGPFAGFMGIIESMDEEHEKLTVMVSIFGRMTPVELAFDQVKR
jgi:transcription termination/antitermination protein NusG